MSNQNESLTRGINFRKIVPILSEEFKECVSKGTVDVSDYFPVSEQGKLYFTKLITKDYLERKDNVNKEVIAEIPKTKFSVLKTIIKYLKP